MKVTTKGQVTIPQYLREKYRITEDTEIDFIEEKNRIILIKSKNKRRESHFRNLRGIATVKMSTDEIMSLTRGK